MNKQGQDECDWEQTSPNSVLAPIGVRRNLAGIRGGDKVSREDRGSHGGARPPCLDESREGAMERSNSTTSRSEQQHQRSMRELSFDLEQPWQRSLLRELSNIERSGDEKHARPRSQKILLGRGQTGDYLVEYDDMDDDTTVLTDASSSIPLRPQAIHRAATPSGRVALFKDEDDDEYTTVSAESGPEILVVPDPAVYRGVGAVFSEGRESRREEKLGLANCGGFYPSLGALSRANALVEDRASNGYFKAQRHRVDEEAKPTYTEPDYPGSANCMCIGFSILDFFETPSTEELGKGRQKRRRTSGSNNLFRSAGSRHSVLGRVNEEEAAESMFLFRGEHGTLSTSLFT